MVFERILLSFVADRLMGQVDVGRVSKGLGKLFSLGVFDGLTTNDSASLQDRVTDKLLEKVRKRIAKFQKGRGLIDDGILGNLTLELLRTICTDPPRPSSSALDILDSRSNLVRVFFDKNSLPDVTGGDAEIILIESMQEWERVCNVDFVRATSIDKAEVIVRTGQLDGADGELLAEAHLGPPGRVQQTFLIDEDEMFSAQPEAGKSVFAAMCVHEFGHILGLSHTLRDGSLAEKGSVMYDVHQPNVTKPQDQDKRRILERFPIPEPRFRF